MPCYQCNDGDYEEARAKRDAEILAYHAQLQREADAEAGLTSDGFKVAFLETLENTDTSLPEDPDFADDWNEIPLTDSQATADTPKKAGRPRKAVSSK